VADAATVNREGVEGVPSVVARAMGRQWYRNHLAGMDPLRGTRPDGTLPPSWKDAFIREFDRAAFLSIPVLNLLVGAILLVQMARDRGSYHQSKFDCAARTVVVRWLAVVGAES
jgi:hypothetical protein